MVDSDFDPQSAIGRRLTLPEFPDAVTLEGLDDWDDVLLLRVRTADRWANATNMTFIAG